MAPSCSLLPFYLLLAATGAAASSASAAATANDCGFSPCPSWEQTWNITRSTIIMPCNYSGYFDYTVAGRFAVVDYDWSNAKEMWANPKQWGGGLAADGKMDCQERLLKQAAMTKAHAKSLGIEQQVWVYRNLVKALPWYSSVRALLNDPAYSGFFLNFAPSAKPFHVPQCDSANGRCSKYYHDQTQAPQSGAGCGNCSNCGCCVDGACDVGLQPSGEYLWNHANGTMLRDFLVNEYVGGEAGLSSPNIDGVFLDDGWGEGGPSEVEEHSVGDMGLSAAQVADIRGNWSETCDAVSRKLAEMKGWSWQMSQNPYPGAFGNANPGGMTPAVCSAFLRKACAPNSSMTTAVNIFTFTRNPVPGHPWPTPFPLKHAEQDVAMFLLSRGEYAYLGYGWQGCQCLPSDKYDHCQPSGYEYPELLERDYGTPVGGQQCSETAPNSGVFTREWSGASVQMDCNTWTPTLAMKGGFITPKE